MKSYFIFAVLSGVSATETCATPDSSLDSSFGCLADGVVASSRHLCFSGSRTFNNTDFNQYCGKEEEKPSGPTTKGTKKAGEACAHYESCVTDHNCVASKCKAVAKDQACMDGCNSDDLFYCAYSTVPNSNDLSGVCKSTVKTGEACTAAHPYRGAQCTDKHYCFDEKCKLRTDLLPLGTLVTGDAKQWCASFFVKDGKCAVLPNAADMKLHHSCTDNSKCNKDGYTSCCGGRCMPNFGLVNTQSLVTMFLQPFDVFAVNAESEAAGTAGLDEYSDLSAYPNLVKYLQVIQYSTRGKKCAKVGATPTFLTLFEDKISFENKDGKMLTAGADGKVFAVTADGKIGTEFKSGAMHAVPSLVLACVALALFV